MGVLKNTNAKVLKQWEIKQQQGEVIPIKRLRYRAKKLQSPAR